ncbi:MAG TPA: hypothetical protein VG733_10330 [Chthoniobacteraceae bacterium]|nr:hypothetical protein [Chthoniobacteraceae bacterium]
MKNERIMDGVAANVRGAHAARVLFAAARRKHPRVVRSGSALRETKNASIQIRTSFLRAVRCEVRSAGRRALHASRVRSQERASHALFKFEGAMSL